jgi:hypothetical protein
MQVDDEGKKLVDIKVLEADLECAKRNGWTAQAKNLEAAIGKARKAAEPAKCTYAQAKNAHRQKDIQANKVFQKFLQLEAQLEEVRAEVRQAYVEEEEAKIKMDELWEAEKVRVEGNPPPKGEPKNTRILVADFMQDEIPFIDLDFEGYLPPVLDRDVVTDSEVQDLVNTRKAFVADFAKQMSDSVKNTFGGAIKEYAARSEALSKQIEEANKRGAAKRRRADEAITAAGGVVDGPTANLAPLPSASSDLCPGRPSVVPVASPAVPVDPGPPLQAAAAVQQSKEEKAETPEEKRAREKAEFFARASPTATKPIKPRVKSQ